MKCEFGKEGEGRAIKNEQTNDSVFKANKSIVMQMLGSTCAISKFPSPAQGLLLSASAEGKGTPHYMENEHNKVSYRKCLDRVWCEVSATQTSLGPVSILN